MFPCGLLGYRMKSYAESGMHRSVENGPLFFSSFPSLRSVGLLPDALKKIKEPLRAKPIDNYPAGSPTGLLD